VLTGAGVDTAYRVRSAALPGYAPQAWARALAGLAAQSSLPAPVSAIVAAATDHGNEVLAHVAASTRQPMAANCISAERTRAGELSRVRRRWAVSLLEDAVLEAQLALLTVAADAVPVPAFGAADSGEAGAVPAATAGFDTYQDYEPELADGDLLVQAAESTERRSGVSLASARVVVGAGRGGGGQEGFAVLAELAGLHGGGAAVSRADAAEACQ